MPSRAPAEPQAKTIPLMAIEPMVLVLFDAGRNAQSSGLSQKWCESVCHT